jgi:hypothetical protein
LPFLEAAVDMLCMPWVYIRSSPRYVLCAISIYPLIASICFMCDKYISVDRLDVLCAISTVYIRETESEVNFLIAFFEVRHQDRGRLTVGRNITLTL